MAFALVVDQRGIFLVGLELVRTRRVLQFGDGIRRPHMFFATNPESIFTTRIERVGQYRIVGKRCTMGAYGLFGNFSQTYAFNLAWRTSEVTRDKSRCQTNRLKHLRAAI